MPGNSEHLKSVSLWNMRKVETIEEFYKRKFNGVPENIRNEIGHFNVFKLDPLLVSMQSRFLTAAEIILRSCW